ncbi:MAG: lantibiotic dehydratase family protein [Sphingobacterium sp.]|jgi:hypothetical protein|nr:lantibiotic dehydratase family protein [Sphingobacterium sp.]
MPIIEIFKNAILRVPLLTLNNYRDKNIITDNRFKEAIQLASNSLYTNFYDKKENGRYGKEAKAIFKYLNRMCSRTVPFGTFAATGVVEIDCDETKRGLTLSCKDFYSITKPSLPLKQFLSRAKHINEVKTIEKNGTLIFNGSSIRLLQPTSDLNRLNYNLIEFSGNESLFGFLKFIEKKRSLESCIDFLIKDGFADNEADGLEIVEKLIIHNICFSDLEINAFSTINNLFNSNSEEVRKIIANINLINSKEIGKRMSEFEILNSQLNCIEKKEHISQKFINTNTFIKSKKIHLSNKLLKKIYNAISILDGLNKETFNTTIDSFKDQLYKKFEHEKVPLLVALDPDLGIGFDDFIDETVRSRIPSIYIGASRRKMGKEYDDINIHKYLLHKYLDFLDSDRKEHIIINENELTLSKLEDLPPTFSGCFEIYSAGKPFEEDSILLKYITSSSPTNLTNRLDESNNGFKELILEIANYENDVFNNVVQADINYLPSDIAGKLLVQRNRLRKFEIPVLTVSSEADNSEIIPLSDLYIYIDFNHNLRLISNSLKKDILPRNGTLHNFSAASNPIYKFLSYFELSFLSKKNYLKLSWGNLLYLRSFLPRVQTNDGIILSLATWVFHIDGTMNNFNQKLLEFKNRYNMPSKVWLCNLEEDKIFFDLEVSMSIEILEKEMRNKGRLIFQEFLFKEASAFIIDGDTGSMYVNELFLNFHKI